LQHIIRQESVICDDTQKIGKGYSLFIEPAHCSRHDAYERGCKELSILSISSSDSGFPDIVVVGGGIAGATIALVLARAGLAVTVLEHLALYRDRVRGEYIQPWGVAEAQHLGISEILVQAGGFFARRIIPYDEINTHHAAEAAARALGELVPGVSGALCVSHPAACLALSQAAEIAGATVIRGIGRLTVTPGSEPTVTFEADGVEHRLSCRLIVGADGRSSTVRAQAGIRLLRDKPTHLISGMLVDRVPEWRQEDIAMGTQGDMCFFIFPQGGQKLRLYACTDLDQRTRYSGLAGPLRFLDDFGGLSCVPCHEALGRATPIGPCATMGGEDTWTEVPFVEGIVLIGDAGGYNGPIIGQGLSLALRDVRLLSEILLEHSEWAPSRLERYGQRRAEGLRRMRIVAEFRTTLTAQFGPEVAARRAHFRDRVRMDPSLGALAVVTHLGPDRAPAWVFDEAIHTNVLNLDQAVAV
jgi:2-polyprenyl-6-methoxyphenol hydroxylase-like FAD-dependent oxidoreductase